MFAPNAKRLSGRNAIVTGAASGLGAGIAQRLAAEGAAVTCADRDGEGAARVAEAIGGDARSAAVDVTDAAALERLAAETRPLDILVANAGIPGPGRAGDTPIDLWERVIGVNLTGVWLSIRAVLPAMVQQRRGAIIATASVAGLAGRHGIAAYAAAKGGVIALTRQLAFDYAEHGIRANAICPGTVPTPMTEYSHGVRAGGDAEAGRALLASRADEIPLGRLGRPEDVAALAAFLASDDAAWITGVAHVIDGGMTLGVAR